MNPAPDPTKPTAQCEATIGGASIQAEIDWKSAYKKSERKLTKANALLVEYKKQTGCPICRQNASPTPTPAAPTQWQTLQMPFTVMPGDQRRRWGFEQWEDVPDNLIGAPLDKCSLSGEYRRPIPPLDATLAPSGEKREPRDSIEHDLKCWPAPFAAVRSGVKPFEFRKDDRDYRTGDILHLREWRPERQGYTGLACAFDVAYIVRGPSFGIPEGYCIMALRPWTNPDASPRAATAVETAYCPNCGGSVRYSMEHFLGFTAFSCTAQATAQPADAGTEDGTMIDLAEKEKWSICWNSRINEFTVQHSAQTVGCIGRGPTLRDAIRNARKGAR